MKRYYLLAIIVMLVGALSSCTYTQLIAVEKNAATPINEDEGGGVDPKPDPTPTFSQEPPEPTVDRCDLFSPEEMKFLHLNIYKGTTSVLVYVTFPDKVIGLEDGLDDGMNWEYSAKLAGKDSIWCELFEGEDYSGRLYCMMPITQFEYNTAQPFDLYVNGCETAVFSIPQQSLLVEEPPTEASGSEEGSFPFLVTILGKICGIQPDSVCGAEYANWCNCRGGNYFCLPHATEGTVPVCSMP